MLNALIKTLEESYRFILGAQDSQMSQNNDRPRDVGTLRRVTLVCGPVVGHNGNNNSCFDVRANKRCVANFHCWDDDDIFSH